MLTAVTVQLPTPEAIIPIEPERRDGLLQLIGASQGVWDDVRSLSAEQHEGSVAIDLQNFC